MALGVVNKMQICKYCHTKVGYLYFECCKCGDFVHLKCMKSNETPGGLAGDVFFIFTCQDCTGRAEEFQRMKMTWLDVVLLILYNLTVRHPQASPGGGYFHKDKQIAKFFNNHYTSIFPHMRSKRRSYRQMLAVTLSRYPQYFQASQPTEKPSRRSPAWYRLARPGMLPNQALLQRKERGGSGRVKKEVVPTESESSTGYDSSSRDGEGSVIAHNQLNFTLNSDPDNMYSRSYVKPSDRLSEILFAGEEESCAQSDDNVDIEAVDADAPIDISATSSGLTIPLPMEQEPIKAPSLTDDDSSSRTLTDQEMGQISDEESIAPPPPPRLLERTTGSNTLPWLTTQPFQTSLCRGMNLSEEAYNLSTMKKRIEQSELVSVAELRVHRKLAVRKLRRERHLPVFDLDAYSREGGIELAAAPSGNKAATCRVLDRFVRTATATVSTSQPSNSFYTRLMGQHSEQYTCFTSPLTHRTLKPFIRRDFSTKPPWLRLLAELQQKVGSQQTTASPIDYCYVRPHHIPAVNSLAEQYFWPGINMSECLQYPDFSCVVLYKKLVVGFAFLVPGTTEAYISFIFTRPEWRRAGIASFMLYHLVQTCMGKDVTLHVSATNPALLLYQKFGFKVEEFVQDFYDKYLPVESTDCRHALLLRLAR